MGTHAHNLQALVSANVADPEVFHTGKQNKIILVVKPQLFL